MPDRLIAVEVGEDRSPEWDCRNEQSRSTRRECLLSSGDQEPRDHHLTDTKERDHLPMFERRDQYAAIVRDGKEYQRRDEDPSEDDEWDWRLGVHCDLGEEVGNTPKKTNEQEESPCFLRQLDLDFTEFMDE